MGDEYYRVNVLRWTGIDLIVGGAFGTVALIIFGALGDGRDFMPDWEHNYLSWSFGLAFVGSVFELCCWSALHCRSQNHAEKRNRPRKAVSHGATRLNKKKLCNCNTERILLRIQIRIIKRFYL